MTSCISSKKVIYFNDIAEDSLYPGVVTMDSITRYVDPVIEPNDVLAITVQTITQSEGNTPITTNSAGSFNSLNGFLVDKNGYIELSLIGFVKVAGLTTAEAREIIKQKAVEFYNKPVVNVRISNFEVQVLGEVNRPGTIAIPSEKAGIMDVIGMSGDLNLTAKRSDVLLIRTEGDKKKFVHLDLNSSSLYRSPYYYVKQRDILYVKPTNFKIQSSDNTFTRYLGMFSGVISVVSLLFIFKVIK